MSAWRGGRSALGRPARRAAGCYPQRGKPCWDLRQGSPRCGCLPGEGGALLYGAPPAGRQAAIRSVGSLAGTSGKAPHAADSVISPRIVGGNPAPEGAWPWQVSFMENNKPICGGSLINEKWVVSAAHCFTKQLNLPTTQYDVLLGAYQLSIPPSSLVVTTVQQVISHPNYNNIDGSPGDIALVELKAPLDLNDYILPVCLPDSSAQFSMDTSCWVTGWGQVKDGEALPPPQTLQELEVPLIDQDTCNSLFNSAPAPDLPQNPVLDDMICAGYPEGGKDACHGDSGGPLVCRCDAGWTLAGVVSWGEGCAEPKHPGVYTLVPYYANWISDNVPNISFVACNHAGWHSSKGIKAL
uniref:Peptidase S1 domain-containing protein n=1 Tax=Podarcis muralis TaxID=64176 RepID=A0A670K7T9_PODMU